MSHTSLAVVSPREVDLFTEQRVDLIRKTIANGAPPLEFEMFIEVCKKTSLDPISKQIYFIQRGGKWTWQTGIDGYRAIADRTGAYAGSDDATFTDGSDGKPASATVTVYKIVQGMRCAFTATARWSEYAVQNNPMWQRMPHTMLAKCAESLALRKAFPTQLSGLYTKEEMQQADREEEGEEASFRVVDTDTGEVTYEPPPPPVAPQRPAQDARAAPGETPAQQQAMRSLHATAKELGLNHDDLHALCVWRGVPSLKDLTTEQTLQLRTWLRQRTPAQLRDALRKAGRDVPDEPPAPSSEPLPDDLELIAQQTDAQMATRGGSAGNDKWSR